MKLVIDFHIEFDNVEDMISFKQKMDKVIINDK